MNDDDRGTGIYVGDWLNRKDVEIATMTLIVINSIMMGIATFPFVYDNPSVQNVFNIIDLLFLIIFTLELFLNFTHKGLDLFKDPWLVFDLCIILLSWLVSGSQVFRAFRIFRTLRVIKKVAVLKNLIDAIFNAIPKVTIVGLLCCVIVVIFSIMFTQMYQDLTGETEYNYFGRLDYTWLTLFQFMTFDNWADVTRDTMTYRELSWLPIMLFVVISGFIAVNLLVGVIVDTINDIGKKDAAKIYGQQYVSFNQSLFRTNPLDEDNFQAATKDDIDDKFESTIVELEKQISLLVETQAALNKQLEEVMNSRSNQ